MAAILFLIEWYDTQFKLLYLRIFVLYCHLFYEINYIHAEYPVKYRE